MPRGRPKRNVIREPAIKFCPVCGNKVSHDKNLYKSNSKLHLGWDGYIPCCKNCFENLYFTYFQRYKQILEQEFKEDSDNEHKTFSPEIGEIERMVLKRLCLLFDMYFSEKIFQNAINSSSTGSLLSNYMRLIHLAQYSTKTYDNTIEEERIKRRLDEKATYTFEDLDKKINKKTAKFFGLGFSDDDYEFLQEQYNDWITRHECKTKSQEEVFKQICYTQLKILKAERLKQDTKDLNGIFLKQLEAAKLQPKQNNSETLSDTQTFGTLIDKWENTRPLPEVDEELKDVDKIGLYIDVFFKGHLSKMMGMKNGFSNLYDKFMKKYTVEKPEYDNEDDDNSEVLFDAIFGGQNMDSNESDNTDD